MNFTIAMHHTGLDVNLCSTSTDASPLYFSENYHYDMTT